ncbi:MAG: hypothetical protein ACREAS_06540, partial [Nitrososphaera sp.]
MSRFSGKQYKGALREHKKTLAMGAFVRAFNRLNPGDMDFQTWVDPTKREYLGKHPELKMPQGVSLPALIEELIEMLMAESVSGKLLHSIFADTDEQPRTGRKIENVTETL